jgi:hypothetical protein
MSQIRKLHHRAMALADDADLFKQRGDMEQARRKFAVAFEFETRAARVWAERFAEVDSTPEPTRSVYFRSAGELALSAGMLQQAEEMARLGLDGPAHSAIKPELVDLLKRIELARTEVNRRRTSKLSDRNGSHPAARKSRSSRRDASADE